MTDAGLAPRAVLAYGALGLPLAFAALPLYVHVPRLYAGLGLSLVAAVAHLHGGRVTLGAAGPGLKVSLRLPIQRASRAPV